VLAAACGVVIARLPEPTFFLLVPLLASAAAWPFGTGSVSERPPPHGVLATTFAVGAAVFFAQSAHRHWTFGSGGRDLGLFYQTWWLMARGLPLDNTLLRMTALGDHMILLEFLAAPLLRVHDGAETLLLVQALAAAFAVLPST